MSRSDEYKLGYQRGYNARCDRWPEYKPPLPPKPIVAAFIEAARNLRNGVDEYFSESEDTP